MESKILVNRVQCRKCGDIIESNDTYDMKRCSCGAVAVDGGHEYVKRVGNDENIIELSEYEDNSTRNINITPFDFSKTVSNLDMYQHLCYYYNESINNLKIIDDNKKKAFSNFKELYHLLKNEYKEYSKVKNSNYILNNGTYAQYVSNITDAYVHCLDVNSYDNLQSNLCNIYDYMSYGFTNIFNLDKNNTFIKTKMDKYLYKICCVELKNSNIYVGKVTWKIHDSVDDKDESITIYFLNHWKQIMLNEIEKIKIIDY